MIDPGEDAGRWTETGRWSVGHDCRGWVICGDRGVRGYDPSSYECHRWRGCGGCARRSLECLAIVTSGIVGRVVAGLVLVGSPLVRRRGGDWCGE